jgi:hypothetical protein
LLLEFDHLFVPPHEKSAETTTDDTEDKVTRQLGVFPAWGSYEYVNPNCDVWLSSNERCKITSNECGKSGTITAREEGD